MGKIFIIDNIVSIIELYSDFLNLKGYRIEAANTVDEFLYKYNNFNPDLIIYDTDMPRSESFKFASLKATDPKIMNMHTILLTGFVSDEKVKDFVHLNNSEFLSKISTNSQVLKKRECLMESSHPESNNAAYSFQNSEQDAHLKH